MGTQMEDERFSRLISNISYLKNEIGHVQEDYQYERTGWLSAISYLQEELAELSRAVAASRENMKAQAFRERDVAARQAQLEAQAERERQTAQALMEENRQLLSTLEKERRERPFGDKQKKQALEDLVTELVTIKKELTDLRTRYNEERRRWKTTNDSLDERVRLLMKENEGEEQALAESTMYYYSHFDQLKKENFVIKEELREENRKVKALEIQLEVVREELMRAKGIDVGSKYSEDRGADGEKYGYDRGIGEKHEAELEGKEGLESTPWASAAPNGSFGSGGHSGAVSRSGSARRSGRMLARGRSFAEEVDESVIGADNVFHSEMGRAGDQDNEMAARIMDLERKNQDLKLQLSRSRGDTGQVTEDKDAVAKELAAIKEKNQDLLSKYRTLEQELDETKKEKEHREKEVQRLQDESAVKKKELNDMKEEMKKRTDDLNNMQKAADTAAEQKQQLDDKEEEIERLRKQLDDLKRKDELSREKIAKIRSGLSSTKTDCEKLQSHFDDLSSIV